MPGDYSRFTDNPQKRFADLLMQQGKVQLDADWNEAFTIHSRRARLQSLDVFGDAAVPRATTDAFKITAKNGGPAPDLNIGAGRMYVGGLLVEAFADDPLTYLTQPFFRPPLPPALPNGDSLVYLDVFQREITYVEDPSLIEPALGDVDTGTRIQTVWQVKAASLVDHPGFNCDSDLSSPSDALLTVTVNTPNDAPDPCQLPEVGGFLDVENRNYRVEVHGTSSGTATIKFGRDPVVSPVQAVRAGGIAGQTIVTVQRIGRDPVLRFESGNFVEIVNERMVLNGDPGIFAKVVSIDEAAREITIDKVVPAADAAAALLPRMIRWDGKGLLSVPGTVTLEAGIDIKITGTNFHNGDYWYFPARAATRSAGPLVNAPPRGVTHYYAPLAMINVGAGKSVTVRTDCRILWPPECDCECSVCVSPESHASGQMTIQMAVDKVKKTKRGGVICLKPGTYLLSKAVEIFSTQKIEIRGHGLATILYTGDEQYAFLLERSLGTVINGLVIKRAGATKARLDAAAINIRHCYSGTVIRNCLIETKRATGDKRADGTVAVMGTGIALDGVVLDVQIIDCDISAATAIGPFITSNQQGTRSILFAVLDLTIEGCWVVAEDAVKLLAAIVGSIHVRQNLILAENSGVRIEGTTVSWLANYVDENEIVCVRDSVGVSANRTSVTNNRVRGTFVLDDASEKLTPGRATDSGIAIYTERQQDALQSCLVTGNRISNCLGAGILIAGRMDELVIKMNFIDHTALGGIVMTGAGRASKVTIDNNEIRDVALGDDPATHHWYGIRTAPESEVAIIGNRIENVGLTPKGKRPSQQASGICADSPRHAQILDNHVTGVAALPAVGFNLAPSPQNPDAMRSGATAISALASAAIDILPPFGAAIVTENVVHAEGLDVAGFATGHCFALRVSGNQARNYALVALATTSFSGWMYINFGTGSNWVSFVPPRSVLIVRSNEFECRGPMNLGLNIVNVIENDLLCTFGGNVCFGTSRFGEAVRLEAETSLVVDSNQVPGSYGAALSLFNSRNRWTVVGNVVDTGISVNGTALAAPWKDLNRT
jgi:hypothetical protein